jgi:hypothetical protein
MSILVGIVDHHGWWKMGLFSIMIILEDLEFPNKEVVNWKMGFDMRKTLVPRMDLAVLPIGFPLGMKKLSVA